MKRIALYLFALALPAAALNAADDQTPNPFLEPLLTTPGLTIEGVPILAEETILDIYRDSGFRTIWTRPQVEELMKLIRTAPEHGLDPADYSSNELFTIMMEWLQDSTPETRARMDILLTESLLRYGYHRRYGKVKASRIDPDINFRRETFHGRSVSQNVHDALASPSLEQFVERVAPTGPLYRGLQNWLNEYRRIQGEGGFPAVPDGPTLRRGDSDPRVAAVRSRLAASGDLPKSADNGSQLFDAELEAAARAFQARHHLGVDGILGRQSFAAMNVPVEALADKIRASLERLRWVSQEDRETLVAVNIAGFRLLFFRDGELAWTTRTMVGKHYRQTPVFRGDIAYMEFNPTWTIPPGILRNDTLPAIKSDPDYLAKKNIEVIDSNGRVIDPSTVDWSRYRTGVPYTLRQTPGPHNALGTVKFIFPNSHFVFLHDTPSRELFDRPERAFSSGCIRVEDPLKLAEVLLNEPGKYGRDELQAIVDSRRTQRINLKPKVPVVLTYLTAGLGDNGEATFMRDIYNRDPAVLSALDGPVVIDLPD